MIITKSALKEISNSLSDLHFEAGGILGSNNNQVISHIVTDIPSILPSCTCSYFPNVNFLNKQIEKWQIENIIFKGVFHSHIYGGKTLSDGDKKYIENIMKSMPVEINSLYFPVFVIPQKELICYKAIRISDTVFIKSENLTVI